MGSEVVSFEKQQATRQNHSDSVHVAAVLRGFHITKNGSSHVHDGTPYRVHDSLWFVELNHREEHGCTKEDSNL